MDSASFGSGDSGGRRYAIHRPQVADERIGDELVVINFVTGKYYGVRGAGVDIWRLLDGSFSEEEVIACWSPASADAEIADKIRHFIRVLEDERLVSASTEPATPNWDLKPLLDPSFAPPQIDRRDDLQDYLTLDPIHDVDDSGWPNQKTLEASSPSRRGQ